MGGFSIKPIGIAKLKVELNDKVFEDSFIVIDTDTTVPILGRDSCAKMNLVKRIYSITDEKQIFLDKYKDLFEGLGRFPQKLDLIIRKDAVPIARPPRRIPLTIKERVKEALDKLSFSKIIEPVNDPSEWVSNLVVIEKPNGSLRICLDPKPLNLAIIQNHYKIPTLDEMRVKLLGANYFSVLDLKDGFYQIELSEESSKICTFSTPFGNYKFKRLPFGINTAPEEFQRRNEQNFGDIPGTLTYIDDILVTGKTEKEHDKNLQEVMNRARSLNVKFNLAKLQYKVLEVSYLGHIFNKDGMKMDPKRINAITEMNEPQSKKELQRFLGMINYVRSFIPNMAEITQPLRELLKLNIEFQWTEKHSSVVNDLKKLLVSAPILQPFDIHKDIIIQTDASKSGVGCVLLQEKRPIAFASRSLSETEENYAQVEKELLAILYACTKFHCYIYGKKVEMHTDHKPLVSIMKNDLCKINSSRLQRMKLKMSIYNLNVVYVPGKEMHIAYHLSRSYIKNDDANEFTEYADVVHTINVSDDKQKLIRVETAKDTVLNELINIYSRGWPNNKKFIPDCVKVFWKH